MAVPCLVTPTSATRLSDGVMPAVMATGVCVEVMRAVLEIWPATVTAAEMRPLIVTQARPLGAIVPTLQGKLTQPPWLETIRLGVKFAGSVSEMVTLVASDGPVLVTKIVYDRSLPGVAGLGSAALLACKVTLLITRTGTLALLLAALLSGLALPT